VANILIVDDNSTNRGLLVTLLGYQGHSLREAADGGEALSLVSSEHPDLVITDILMPTMDGYEFVRRLRLVREIAHTPVIFCTAHFREHDAKDLARECGVEYVLVKPLDLDAVTAAVDACLNKTATARVRPVDDDFDREHLQLLLNKLKDQTDKLTVVNLQLEELIDTTLLHLASESEPHRLLQEFCKSARQLISARFALVGLVSAGGEVADALAVSGMDWESYSRFNKTQEAQLAIAALIRNDGGAPRPVRLRNPDGNPAALGFPPDYPRFDSILAAPIVSPTRTYGWLCLFHKLGATEFSQEEERLAGILGALAGRIYENGSLYALAQEHADKLEQELEERTRAEAETHDAVQRLNMALKASGTGIWTWDAINNLMVWDENIYAMCGLAPGAFGSTFEDSAAVVHPEDRDATVQAIQRCTPQQPECAMACRVIWPDGSIHFLEASGRAFYDEGGRLVRMTGTTRDVTEHRQLEEQFRQAQKMEAVGQLAGGIAHDFNNVLNVILGYSDLLLDKSTPQDPVYSRIQEIRKAGEQAAGLTQQLLAFSRRQVLQPRVLNLPDILHDMDEMLHRTIGADIEITIASDEHLARVKVDPSQMQQVLLNLAVNARDAMPRGGNLVLEARNATLDESDARSHNVPTGRYVMLAVSDNGCGMTAEVQKQAFEPFFTTKQVGQGTGLGLATVYGIVQQSGGHIWLYSEPGIGTTFQIYFPRVDQPEEPKQQESPQPMLTGEGTILAVEDDTGLRSLIEEVLSSAGYSVFVAPDGASALRISDEYAGRIQLLLTDVILPKMSGTEIASRLTGLRPEMKVLFMSGYTKNAMAANGTLDSEVNFIQKPWTPRGLCEKIHTVLTTPSSTHTQRILVVDDEAGVRGWLTEVLEGAGHQVFTAQDGLEARALAKGHSIDLVITDISMPNEEGLGMIRALRKAHPELRIIAMSGAFGPDILMDAKILGANAALAKPVTAETVLQCVRDLARVREKV
jgi:PAS domain S-box-containing protein